MGLIKSATLFGITFPNQDAREKPLRGGETPPRTTDDAPGERSLSLWSNIDQVSFTLDVDYSTNDQAGEASTDRPLRAQTTKRRPVRSRVRLCRVEHSCATGYALALHISR